jgi:hypothetical protein
MADLTLGEVGKQLVINLYKIDNTVSPPAQVPLNLTGATVTLSWIITDPNSQPLKPTNIVTMTILDPINGIVSYTFQAGDLVKSPASTMGKNGAFRFSVLATFPGGSTILYTNNDGLLAIKDDSIL